MPRWLRLGSFLGLLLLSRSWAAADELCAYKRFTPEEGDIWTFTNLGNSHCKRKVRLQKDAGVYRAVPRVKPPPLSGGPVAAGGLSIAGDPDPSFAEHIRRAAALYNLPEELLHAVMVVESNFNPVAVSQKGAAGLMQLMPQTANEMYVADVWSPEQNIYGGARYLRVLANQYQGDVAKMLAAYNAGPEAVRRAGDKIPDIAETRAYVRKVIALYERLRAKKEGIARAQGY